MLETETAQRRRPPGSPVQEVACAVPSHRSSRLTSVSYLELSYYRAVVRAPPGFEFRLGYCGQIFAMARASAFAFEGEVPLALSQSWLSASREPSPWDLPDPLPGGRVEAASQTWAFNETICS